MANGEEHVLIVVTRSLYENSLGSARPGPDSYGYKEPNLCTLIVMSYLLLDFDALGLRGIGSRLCSSTMSNKARFLEVARVWLIPKTEW